MKKEDVKIKVWIDQDLCTGDGLCEEICPSVFAMHDDGLAYVKEPEWKTIYGPNARQGMNPFIKEPLEWPQYPEKMSKQQ